MIKLFLRYLALAITQLAVGIAIIMLVIACNSDTQLNNTQIDKSRSRRVDVSSPTEDKILQIWWDKGYSPEEDAASDIDMVLGLGSGESSDDALYDQAVAIVAKDRKCSTSYIQRKLGIGYNKAARLVEQMEENHIVTTANHVGKREILLPEH